MILKHIKKSKNCIVFIISMFIFIILVSSLVVHFNSPNNSITLHNNKQNTFLAQSIFQTRWISETHEKQWIKNSEFDTGEDWSSFEQGDTSDINAYLSSGQANFEVLGEQGVFNITEKPNSEWKHIKNPFNVTLPNSSAINSDGCFAFHHWGEDANQTVMVQWARNFTTNVDMSEYIITSASLQITVNATVHADNGGWTAAQGWQNDERQPHGIERPGDYNQLPPDNGVAVGDYAKFFLLISDIYNGTLYEAVYLRTDEITNLGEDDAGDYDYLNDTIAFPDSNEDLKFYLEQALNTDNRNFTITLGIFINCEDSYTYDRDTFDELLIKNVSLIFNYEKKINQFTSASWKYSGKEIEGKNVEVTEARLYFDYKIDSLWTSDAPNSEIKIYINDEIYSGSVKLSSASLIFEEARDNGFDVTGLVPDDEDITVKIQVLLSDEFGLDHNIVISIDNIELDITYNEYLPAEQSLLYEILLIIAIISAICLTCYYIYYKKVLRYPKAVRKVRKFRKTLKKKENPKVDIIERSKGFSEIYNSKTSNVKKYMKKNEPEPQKISKKQYGKNLTKKTSKISSQEKKELFANGEKIIIIFLILGTLFFSSFLMILSSSNLTILHERNRKTLKLAQTDSDQLFKTTRTEQWIENSNFDDEEGWDSSIDGDNRDLDADIDDGEAKFKVIGGSGEKSIYEDTSSDNWNLTRNPFNMSLPDSYIFDVKGWRCTHQWGEDINQTVQVRWQKNYTTDVDMSDYIITSASLNAYINATVHEINGHANPGGIDRPGDYEASSGWQISTGDYATFFIIISDLDKNRAYEAISYRTDEGINLGVNNGQTYDYLYDTRINVEDQEDLIFYLEQALNNDYRNFAITIGIEIFSEDNFGTDNDMWDELLFKNLTLTFSYEKKIDKASSVSWEYEGKEIEEENVEITKGLLYFSYKIDKSWTSLSSNSEIRILINNELFGDTIKLSDAEDKFEDANEDGLEITDLISDDEEIELNIQVYIAEEFRTIDSYKISIDDVTLDITYDVISTAQQTLLFQIFFIIATIGVGCLTVYIIYYQRVLKYPKPVRKVRKYRRNIKKNKDLKIKIINREDSFHTIYKSKYGNAENLLKTPLTKKVLDEERKFKEDIRITANNLKENP